ncbi:MAG: Ketoisovalerate oxidoreductase subunit VorB [Methanomassiliicoccales archaeon PtaB.Bin215]|nr:MAG: Ketoisovalerate oxidoreductase subunit VorB [Methanomassiliicoccales archaeon PtaB.Bin215]
MILADGMIGQMMEGVTFPEPRDLSKLPARPWAAGGQSATHRPINHISSMNLIPDELEAKVHERFKRYEEIKKKEIRFEEVNTDKADLILVAYGTSSRVCLGAQQLAKAAGIELGIFRPISLWPFPYERIAELAGKGKRFLTVEMSMGQMVQDVQLAVAGKAQVSFYGRCGGNIPTEEAVLAEARKLLGK